MTTDATDAADAAAEVLVAFWRRSQPLDLRTRQLCGRLAAVLDALEAPAGGGVDLDQDAPAVAAALRRATERDPEAAGLVSQLARAAPPRPGERSAAPHVPAQNVTVSGNGSVGLAVGRDLHLGGRSLSDLVGPIAGPAPPQAPPPAAKTDVVLVVAADPVDQKRLRLGLEAREIREALRASPGHDRWTVDTWSSVRFRDLSQALLEHAPRVVHFSGHGSKEGALLLEDESGSARPTRPEALVDLFAASGETVECVVLNACYSEPQARAISACVPYVIGSASVVLDAAAIRFSVGFYQALGAGRAIPQAYRVGCAHFRGNDNPGDPAPLLIARPS